MSKHVVSVHFNSETIENNPLLLPFVESLRYAGYLTFHHDKRRTLSVNLLCPRGLNREVWADNNIERLKSFGFDAMTTKDRESHNPNERIK